MLFHLQDDISGLNGEGGESVDMPTGMAQTVSVGEQDSGLCSDLD